MSRLELSITVSCVWRLLCTLVGLERLHSKKKRIQSRLDQIRAHIRPCTLAMWRTQLGQEISLIGIEPMPSPQAQPPASIGIHTVSRISALQLANGIGRDIAPGAWPRVTANIRHAPHDRDRTSAGFPSRPRRSAVGNVSPPRDETRTRLIDTLNTPITKRGLWHTHTHTRDKKHHRLRASHLQPHSTLPPSPSWQNR